MDNPTGSNGNKGEEFNEERGTITTPVPVSFFTWMVAIPSSTSGLDNGSGKGEVSCVFQGSSPLVCFTRRSSSAGAQQDKDCWGLRVVGSSGGWQGRASPARQQGRPGGSQVQPKAQITRQVHGDDAGPKSNCGGNMWVRVQNKRTYCCDGAGDQPSSSTVQAGTEAEMGLLASRQGVGEDPGEAHPGHEVLSVP